MFQQNKLVNNGQFLRRSKRFSLFSLVFIINFSFFPRLASQTQDSPIDSVRLQSVVIQATRAGENDPVPHTNLSATQLEKIYQAQDVPFLLSGVPSLVETSDGGIGTGYTGLRIRGSDPTRVNVTINGVPLNDAESQGVFWVNLPDLTSSATEIQVQRGVGTSTNGAGAFGATVNIDISKIDPEPNASLSVAQGSFNTQRYTAQAATGLIENRWAFSGRISKIQTDGYIERARADLNSVHLSAAFLTEKQSIQAHILHGHEETYQAWNGVPAQFISDPSKRTFNTGGMEKPGGAYENEIDNYTQRHHLVHYRLLLPNNLILQLNGHYTRGYGFFEQYKADQDLGLYGLNQPDTLPYPDLVRQRWLDNHFYGLTYALRWTPAVNPVFFSRNPEFLLGGGINQYEGRHYDQIIWSEYSYGIPKDFIYNDNDAVKTDGNVFVKMHFAFAKGILAMADLQYRRVEYQFYGFDENRQSAEQNAILHFFNPKFGLSWQFTPDWTAYGYFGIANREPNRDDFTQSTPQGRPKAEQLLDFEVGIKRQHQRIAVTANFFWMQYRNQLVLNGRINDVGAYTRTNVPDSYRAGVEIEAVWMAADRLFFSANGAFSSNKISEFTEYRDDWSTGDQTQFQYRNSDIAFSPRAIARTEATFQALPLSSKFGLTLTLATKYVSRQFLDNTSNPATTLPEYWFTDFRVNFKVNPRSGHPFSVVLAVNNLLDKQYVSNGWTYRFTSPEYDPRPDDPYSRLESGNVYHQAGFFPQARRNIMAAVMVRW